MKHLAATCLLGCALAGPIASAADAPLMRAPVGVVNPTQQLNGPYPPGNVIVRLNGLKALNEVVFPAIANGSGILNKDIASIPRFSRVRLMGASPLTFGVRVDVDVTDVKLRAAVGADDWRSTPVAAGAQQMRIDSNFNFADASVKFTLRIRSRPQGEIAAVVPEPVKRFANLNETFFIEMHGFNGSLDALFEKDGNGLKVKSVEEFKLFLTGVSVSDPGWLVEIANATFSLNELLKLDGGYVTDANAAATQLVNLVLRQNLGLESQLKSAINAALKAIDTQQFATQELPIGAGTALFVTPALARIESGANWLSSEWQVGIDGRPNDAVPGLPPRGAATMSGLEPASATPARGDVQAFIPYTLIEHVLYELIQAGLLRDVVVPNATSGGVGDGFRAHIVPTESPKLARDPDDPNLLLLQFAARMDDATIGSVSLAPRPGIPTPVPVAPRLDITTVDATAAFAIRMRVGVSQPSGVYVEFTSVTLQNLSGQMRVGPVVTNLAPARTQLQNAINTALRQRATQVTLISRTVGIQPPLKAFVVKPSLGAVYVGVPIRIGT